VFGLSYGLIKNDDRSSFRYFSLVNISTEFANFGKGRSFRLGTGVSLGLHGRIQSRFSLLTEFRSDWFWFGPQSFHRLAFNSQINFHMSNEVSFFLSYGENFANNRFAKIGVLSFF